MTHQNAIPSGWDIGDIPNLSGQRFLITGGTSGLGKAAAMELARHGADITITARNLSKGQQVIDEIGKGRVIEMDLTIL